MGGALGKKAEWLMRECGRVAEWKNRGVGELTHWSAMTWGEHWRQRVGVVLQAGAAISSSIVIAAKDWRGEMKSRIRQAVDKY